MTARLTLGQARRTALAAQGFLDPPHARPSLRTVDRVVSRTGLIQIDSVNVLARAHLMPIFSRSGAYDTALLDRAVAQRRIVEYWAHEAAFMPVGLWPLMHRRREAFRARDARAGIAVERPDLVASVLEQIARRGASTARELDDATPRRNDHWGWNWSAAKHALEHLMRVGDLVVAGRNGAFERRYDLPERVLPAAVLDPGAVPSEHEAVRRLVMAAARSHGVATLGCLADYHRHRLGPVRAAVRELVAEGRLEPVAVRDWTDEAYLHPEARLPRRVDAQTVLSPFDPVVWRRERASGLFGFDYRIEIYTPAHRRVHGYYVLPFLLGERLVARVDLKADRTAAGGVLLVQGAFAEPGAPSETPERLAETLRSVAAWQGLADVAVRPHGDLAPGVAAALARGGGAGRS